MKKIYLTLIVLVTFSISCTKNFEDFNTDQKNPPEVEGEFLFTNAQKELVDQISSTNVNDNIWKLVTQYWTETTYTDEANYDIINRNIPEQIFRAYYRYVLKPLKEARELISADPIVGNETDRTKANKLLIIDLMEVYCYHNLVNIFGDVPYTDAIDIENINPKYDDAATIYADLLKRVDDVIDNLELPTGALEIGSYDEADLFFSGDVSSWIAFAHSLKLKIGLCLADVNPGVAQAAVEAAAPNILSTDVLLNYEGAIPNANPLYEDLVASGRADFVPANTIIDLMASLYDPRMDMYFDDQIDTSGNGDFVYVGGAYGYSNSYNTNSHIDDGIEAPDFPGLLMTTSELQFYLAEAAARGWNVGKDAKTAYDDAIAASFVFWGVDGAASYLDSAYVNYDSLTAAGKTWQEIIGTQAYISFYTRGLVAYNVYRRLDYPLMNVAPNAETEDGIVPVRFTYPVNEQTLNAANYAAASAAIGGDAMETKLFWDVKDPE